MRQMGFNSPMGLAASTVMWTGKFSAAQAPAATMKQKIASAKFLAEGIMMKVSLDEMVADNKKLAGKIKPAAK
jgi:hypothetical protein